jgi:hypothetical protein
MDSTARFDGRWHIAAFRTSNPTDALLDPLLSGIWFLYLLAWGAFPIRFAAELYYMFVGVVAPSGQYWFYCLMVPAACILPTLFYRNIRRCETRNDEGMVRVW